MKVRCKMKSVWRVALFLSLASQIVAAEKPDVETIVNKANVVAYYQGKDGKATVKMTITSKQGQKRTHQFNILRKDVKDGGDQKYFVYFQRPAYVRNMVYLVDKHTAEDRDDDRTLPELSIDLLGLVEMSDDFDAVHTHDAVDEPHPTNFTIFSDVGVPNAFRRASSAAPEMWVYTVDDGLAALRRLEADDFYPVDPLESQC